MAARNVRMPSGSDEESTDEYEVLEDRPFTDTDTLGEEHRVGPSGARAPTRPERSRDEDDPNDRTDSWPQAPVPK